MIVGENLSSMANSWSVEGNVDRVVSRMTKVLFMTVVCKIEELQ